MKMVRKYIDNEIKGLKSKVFNEGLTKKQVIKQCKIVLNNVHGSYLTIKELKNSNKPELKAVGYLAEANINRRIQIIKKGIKDGSYNLKELDKELGRVKKIGEKIKKHCPNLEDYVDREIKNFKKFLESYKHKF
jgi:hypothetical protein